MPRRRKRVLLALIDPLAVPVAFVVALAALYSFAPPAALLAAQLPAMIVLSCCALALSRATGTAGIRLKEFDRDGAILLAGLAAALAAASALLARLGISTMPAGFHLVFGLSFFAAASGIRLVALQVLLHIYRQSAAVTRVLIYGAGRSGMTLAAALRGHPRIVPVAFVDDNATLCQLTLAGLPVVPGARVERAAREFRADRIILAMPSLSAARLTVLSRRLERIGLEVMTLPAFAQLVGDRDILGLLEPARPLALLSRGEHCGGSPAAAAAYRGASVLVSGAGGTIGLELCRQIVGCSPRRLVLLEQGELALYSALRELEVLAEGRGIELVGVLGSVTDPVLVRRAIAGNGVQVVLHAAAYKHVPLVEGNVRAAAVNNVIGTAILAQCARDLGVARFVLVSTDKAVAPANVMGATKRVAELVVQDLASRSRKTRFSIVRFGNVLGSSGSVLPLFREQIAQGGPITLTHPDMERYFMTTREAVHLVLRAGSLARGGEVFVLDMGRPVRIADLARRLVEASGLRLRDADTPDGDIEIVVTGLRKGEKLREAEMIGPGAMTTAHPKIFTVPADGLSEIEVAALLRDIRERVAEDDEAGLCALLMRAAAARPGADAGTAGGERAAEAAGLS